MTPSVTEKTVPDFVLRSGLRRLSVSEYHRMIDARVFEEGEPLELIEGYLVPKMTRNPRHDSTIQRVLRKLLAAVPPSWDLRCQSAITLSDSEPEPDFCVVRGDASAYDEHHPLPAEVGVVIEVANTSLDFDRVDKARVYARAGIAVYWVVNVADRRVEVFDGPSGPTTAPAYAKQTLYTPGDSVPLILDSVTAASLLVSDLVP